MAFIQNRTNDNFSASKIHAAARLETNALGQLVCVINSYATLAAFELNKLNWQDVHPIPVEHAGNPQAWLTGPEGPFAGATMLVETTPLDQVKSLKWAQIKGERDRRETGGFPYLGQTFDSDARSVQRITTAALAAQAAVAAGQSFELDWTCADNSVMSLTAPQIAAMPDALASHAAVLHAVARALRENMDAATSVDDVNAIAWPQLSEITQ